MRIAILGGAFDPIHKGHLQIAKVALKKLPIDEVWFMPSAETPLKPSQIACFQDRCAMIQAAIRPYRHMKLCTLEQELGGISYTIETVKYLQKQYPMHTFCWLIGDDQALQFDKWKASEELKKRIPFYVFSREKEDIVLPDGLHKVSMDLLEISSKEIRRGYKLHLVPKSVRIYMGKHYLYLEGMVRERMSEKRFAHSISVAKLCVELARAHHLDEQIAYAMGIMHDVCKEMPYAKARIWIENNEPAYLSEAPAIWHGYIGADVCKKKFFIQDHRIPEAIYHHVKGRNKTDYDRILFIADKLDPSRGYDSSKEIEISMKDLKEGFMIVKQQQEAYLKKDGTISS